MTVLLDAGHGAPDIGSTGVTGTGEEIPEKDLTLPLVLRAADDLRGRGIRVVLSRGVVGSDATDTASNAAQDLVLRGATPAAERPP